MLHDRNGSGAYGVAAAILLATAILLVETSAAAEQPAAAPAVDITAVLVAQALAYEHGEGVPKDQRKAALLYCEAARAGDAEAMFSLGWMYANGRGVARSDAMAALLFARARRPRVMSTLDRCRSTSATIRASFRTACGRRSPIRPSRSWTTARTRSRTFQRTSARLRNWS